MAVLDVLPYPNPFLRRRAHEVTEFDDGLREIVTNMEETMAARDGIGLAATQVGIDLRLLILSPFLIGLLLGATSADLVGVVFVVYMYFVIDF